MMQIILNHVLSAERLTYVHIELGSTLDSLTEIFYQRQTVTTSLTAAFDGSFSGQFLKIWIEATDYLTICEIEVYAEESKYTYMYKQLTCQCMY